MQIRNETGGEFIDLFALAEDDRWDDDRYAVYQWPTVEVDGITTTYRVIRHPFAPAFVAEWHRAGDDPVVIASGEPRELVRMVEAITGTPPLHRWDCLCGDCPQSADNARRERVQWHCEEEK